MAQHENRKLLYKLVQEGLDYLGSRNRTPKFLTLNLEEMINHIMPDHPYISTSWNVKHMYKLMVPHANFVQVERAEILGWIYQMFQASHNLLDDMVDQDDVRFGQPTWSKLHNHEVSTILFDFLIFDSIIYYLLEKYFGHLEKVYNEIVRVFRRTRLQTGKGNRMEGTVRVKYSSFYTNSETESFVSNFGIAEWELLAQMKNSVHITLPLSLAIVLAEEAKADHGEALRDAEQVTNKIAQWVAVNDDLYDIFTFNRNNDALYSDAKNGQKSFLWISAKKLCQNEAEWSEFITRYGRDDVECFRWIKDFFERLNVPLMVSKFSVKLEEEIQTEIASKFRNADTLGKTLLWWFKFVKTGMELDKTGDLDEMLWRFGPLSPSQDAEKTRKTPNNKSLAK